MQNETLKIDPTKIVVEGKLGGVVDLSYGENHPDRNKMLALYSKGKQMQWDAEERLNWDHECDPDNPMGLPDQAIPFFGTDIYNKLGPKDLAELRRHMQSWQIGQFLAGEQGAIMCAGKVAVEVPDYNAKLYAGTQTIDEARHMEAFDRFTRDKIGLRYNPNDAMTLMLKDVIAAKDWDFTFLGMQILVEGLGLASFSRVRDHAQDPLAKTMFAYVMADEARHVAFGRYALKDIYKDMSDSEKRIREEFVIEGSLILRDRFTYKEVWENLGLPVEQCIGYMLESPIMKMFQRQLFGRIVPAIKEIGLWSPMVQDAYLKMGVLDLADINLYEVEAQDEVKADEMEQAINQAIEDAKGAA